MHNIHKLLDTRKLAELPFCLEEDSRESPKSADILHGNQKTTLSAPQCEQSNGKRIMCTLSCILKLVLSFALKGSKSFLAIISYFAVNLRRSAQMGPSVVPCRRGPKLYYTHSLKLTFQQPVSFIGETDTSCGKLRPAFSLKSHR